MNKKICIVVDHPDRDLNGYIYLISKLKLKQAVYYLVPYYNFREIYIIRPDIVILNHSRWIYSNFLKILKILNTSIFILDTEGGMITMDLIKEYILFSQIKKNVNYVDGFFIWSDKIKEEILKLNKNLDDKKLIVTGNPRFEYIYSRRKKKINGNVLFNLNFATVNPKFSTIENEIKLLIKQGKSKNYLKNYVAHQKKMQKKFIELIKFVSESKLKKIVIRPHPYESKKIYETIFKDKKNIEINHTRNLIQEISNSSVVIQNNCATAIDAVLLSRPTFFYKPFKSKYLDQKLISDISFVYKSKKDVLFNILSLKNKKKLYNKKSLNLINKKYSTLNGGISLIEKTLKSKFKKNNNKYIDMFALLLRYKEFFYFTKTLAKVYLGLRFTNYFRAQFSKKCININLLYDFINADPKFKSFFKKKKISNFEKYSKNFFSIKIN